MPTYAKSRPLFEGPIVWRAVVDSFRKLTPGVQVRNPVMFVVYVGQHPDLGAVHPGPRRKG